MQLIQIPVFFLAAVISVSCASQPDSAPMSTASTQGTTLVQTGYVTDVRDITIRSSQQSVAGATVGALLGGIAGSNIGSGFGRTAATVAGATAGSITGQHVGKSNGDTSLIRLTVRFESGDVRTYDIEPGAAFRVGEQVKVITTAGKVRVTH